MSLITTALTDYVNNNKTGLIAKASLGAPSLNYLNIQSGIQGKATLNVLDTSITFGDGKTCAWNEAGTSTVTEREIEVVPLKVNMTFCDKSLYGKAANYDVRMSANADALPFEQVFIQDVVNGVQEELDEMIWQGTGTGNSFEGFNVLLASQKVSLTGTTAKEDIDSVYMDIPAEVLKSAVIFCSLDTFRTYVSELTAANLFHYNPTDDGSFVLTIPGTNTKLIGLPGISAKDIFAGRPDDFYFGCDLASDSEEFDFWYSQDNRQHRLAIGLSGGVQVSFPGLVIYAERA